MIVKSIFLKQTHYIYLLCTNEMHNVAPILLCRGLLPVLLAPPHLSVSLQEDTSYGNKPTVLILVNRHRLHALFPYSQDLTDSCFNNASKSGERLYRRAQRWSELGLR